MSVTNEQLNAYIHGTLTQAERAAIETALRSDGAMRARLQQLRLTQQSIQAAVSAEIESQTPPSNMTFDAIADRVRTQRPARRLQGMQRLISAFAGLAAMLVIIFALSYSLVDRDPFQPEGAPATVVVTVDSPLQVVTPQPTFTLVPNLNDGGSSIPTRGAEPSPTPTSSPTPQAGEDGAADGTNSAEGNNSVPTRTPQP